MVQFLLEELGRGGTIMHGRPRLREDHRQRDECCDKRQDGKAWNHVVRNVVWGRGCVEEKYDIRALLL